MEHKKAPTALSHPQLIMLESVTMMVSMTDLRVHGCRLHEAEANHSNLLHLHQLPERVNEQQTTVEDLTELKYFHTHTLH